MKEEWREVPWRPSYKISSRGRCRGPSKKILKPYPNSWGYLRVCIEINGVATNATIHSLVALAFIGPRPDGYEVCHLNGNNQDNRLVNLAYVTPRENASHKILHGTLLVGEDSGRSKLKEKEVKFIIKNHKSWDRKFSTARLAKVFGVDKTTISDIVHNRSWKHIERGSNE